MTSIKQQCERRAHQTRILSCICATIFSVAATVELAAAVVSFHGLGDLPGGDISSGASAVSADGMVVVGSSHSASGIEAYRWSLLEGIVALGDLAGGDFDSRATSVSADGSVIVGNAHSVNGVEAFRWVDGIGMTGLGDLPGGRYESGASGVSADGNIVVGLSSSSLGATVEAYYWTLGSGMTGIGSLPWWPYESIASDVSGDGTVVVGRSLSAEGNNAAFRWTQEQGMVALDASIDSSNAFAISCDGTTIVGRAILVGEQEAFRWTESEGIVGLGYLYSTGSFISSESLDVSADGSIIVGQSSNDSFQAAFIWDESHGMRALHDVLTDLGLDLAGWTLTEATGISDDGLTIVGTGINPNGDTEAFIATLPEPGTLFGVLAGLPVLLRRRGR